MGLATTIADEAQPALEQSCPQRLWTGWAGALTVVCGAILLAGYRCLAHPTVPSRAGYVFLLLLTCFVMVAIELVAFRAYRHQFDFSRRRILSRADHRDVGRQYGALILTLALSWIAYAVLNEYALRFSRLFTPAFEKSWYRPFFLLFQSGTIILAVAALPYFYFCASFRRWAREDDELLRLWNGYVALLHSRMPDAGFSAAIRALLVKFFFIPVMTVFFINNAASFEREFIAFLAEPGGWNVTLAGRLFYVLFEGVYLIDVSLVLLGYMCCFRFLDAHIRSAEPTLLGWAVTLACYPPFNHSILGLYLPADPNSHAWCVALAGIPWLYYLVGAGILMLLGVYLYATIAFGLRFSNLTHRGIICRGPYAWIRHPAYAAKNLSWWVMSVPSMSSPVDLIRLLLVNVIYVLRAITEERHLSRDPVYREYLQRVKWRFIPGIF